MDSATVVTTSALLALLVERVTNGIVIALGYSARWRRHMEAGPVAGPAEVAAKERNRRVATFALSAAIAVVGAFLLRVNVFGPLGIAGLEGAAGFVVTGLLLAAGAEPIHELLQGRQRREPAAPPAPLHVTGTLVLQPPAPDVLVAAVDASPSLPRPAPGP